MMRGSDERPCLITRASTEDQAAARDKGGSASADDGGSKGKGRVSAGTEQINKDLVVAWNADSVEPSHHVAKNNTDTDNTISSSSDSNSKSIGGDNRETVNILLTLFRNSHQDVQAGILDGILGLCNISQLRYSLISLSLSLPLSLFVIS
jgi:hypothetical protein